MNYRHGFHAGNFADVFKHVLLTRILLYLMRKDTPLCYVDTHAGRGGYDLTQAEAERGQEWRGGIEKLAAASIPADVLGLLKPYRAAVGLADDGSPPRRYPGSPLLAQKILRATDRLLLNELQSKEAAVLKRTVGLDARAHVSTLDGYAALNALLPPRERRGFVLIDPPYENPDEFKNLEAALMRTYRKWPTGTYAVWYPIKETAVADAFVGRLAVGRGLRLELFLDRQPRMGRHDRLALIGCGLLVLNPPFVLAQEAEKIVPFLAKTLGHEGRGAWIIEPVPGLAA